MTLGNDKGGLAYGDLYEPVVFGSAGGGQTGGAGGGRIWLNVTDTLLLDGLLTAGGENGKSSSRHAGGGGSGGSVWLHCNTITGNATRNVTCNVTPSQVMCNTITGYTLNTYKLFVH